MTSWDDFLPTTTSSMPSLTLLDDRCRCSVCKDYLQGPMMTLCGHTFCSLCIRRALNSDGRCPTCRSLEEESKLRKNLMIEEIVEAFLPFRQSLMDYAPAVVETASTSDCKNDNHQDTYIEDSDQDVTCSPSPTSQHQTRSSSRVTRASRTNAKNSHKSEEIALPAGYILCPICQAHIHQDKADHHVNRCLEGKSSPQPTLNHGDAQDKSHYFDEPPRPRRSATPTNKAGTATTMTRLPKMSYAAMTDAKLRKTMVDMGINSTGNRAQLQRRCTEFIAMWNSNLDSKRPKSKKELLSDLKAWDRVQAKPIIKVTDEEIDSAHHSGKFDSNFQDLIAQAKESMRKRKAVEKGEASENSKDESGHVDKRQQTESI